MAICDRSGSAITYIFLGRTTRLFVGSDPLIGAQPAQILIPLIAILIWLWAFISDWGATDLTAFTLGPFLAMLATKTPTPACALRNFNTLAVLVLIMFASAAVFAVIADVPPTGFTTKWTRLL